MFVFCMVLFGAVGPHLLCLSPYVIFWNLCGSFGPCMCFVLGLSMHGRKVCYRTRELSSLCFSFIQLKFAWYFCMVSFTFYSCMEIKVPCFTFKLYVFSLVWQFCIVSLTCQACILNCVQPKEAGSTFPFVTWAIALVCSFCPISFS